MYVLRVRKNLEMGKIYYEGAADALIALVNLAESMDMDMVTMERAISKDKKYEFWVEEE